MCCLQVVGVSLAVYKLWPASFGTVLRDFVCYGKTRWLLSWGRVMKGGFYGINTVLILDLGTVRIRLGLYGISEGKFWSF